MASKRLVNLDSGRIEFKLINLEVSGSVDSFLTNFLSTPGRDDRKNGAFSGVLGGSIGLLRF